LFERDGLDEFYINYVLKIFCSKLRLIGWMLRFFGTPFPFLCSIRHWSFTL